MENASRAFLDAVRKSMRQIRTAIGSATINPDLLTAAERIQYQGYLHREDTNAVILDLAKSGVAIKEIVRRTGHSRGLVRRVLRGQRSDVFRVRENSLEVYLPWLDAQWSAGHRNGTQLWRELTRQPSGPTREIIQSLRPVLFVPPLKLVPSLTRYSEFMTQIRHPLARFQAGHKLHSFVHCSNLFPGHGPSSTPSKVLPMSPVIFVTYVSGLHPV